MHKVRSRHHGTLAIKNRCPPCPESLRCDSVAVAHVGAARPPMLTAVVKLRWQFWELIPRCKNA